MQLTYQKISLEHADALQSLWSDPEVIKYTNIESSLDFNSFTLIDSQSDLTKQNQNKFQINNYKLKLYS